MHGCDVGSDLVVDAGVDSMGGFVEGGVGIGTKTSLLTTELENATAKLRQQQDGNEERRRQLEFLQKGGDPLNFIFVNSASPSVQSTSLTDKHPDRFVTSEVKGSSGTTTSPHGDSVESSGRPGAPQLCEPNSADNLMLFDGENKFVGGGRGSRHPSSSNVTPSGQFSKFDESENGKGLGSPSVFGIPKKAYKRRYRPRTNRDIARSDSSDIGRGGHDTSLPSKHFPQDVKRLVSDSDKDQNSSQFPSPYGGMSLKTMPSDNQLELEVDGVIAAESTTDFRKDDNQLDLEMPIQEALERSLLSPGKEKIGSAALDCQPCTTERGVENQASSSQMNGLGSAKDNKKGFLNEAENNGAALGTKGLDSESSCTQTSPSIDGHNDSEMCANPSVLDSNSDLNGQLVVPEGIPVIESDVKVENETKADANSGLNKEAFSSYHSVPKSPEELVGTVSDLQSEIKDKLITEITEELGPSESEITRSCRVPKGEDSDLKNVCNVGVQGTIDSCILKHSESASQPRVPNLVPEGKASMIQGDEDSILKEAQIIEAKRKRIAELSAVTCPQEDRQKSHWEYVLEEMVWLANDFAQERLWKLTAAGQICHQVAFSSRLKIVERNRSWEQKGIAHSVAKAVMDFWYFVKGKSKKPEFPRPKKDYTLAIREYATRFLKYNDFDVPKCKAEAPPTPDRISDGGIMDTSYEDHLAEEDLFYPVPLGSMDAYRKSIESYTQLCEKTGSSMQVEAETSACDAVAACAYELDEGETSAYDRSRFFQKTRNIHLKTHSSRPYDGADVLYAPCAENRVGPHQSVLPGKRPAGSHMSIPTKRVRTASRPRVLSPFGATAGCVQFPIKTEASSGDTGSFQDDQSTLHSLEVESVGDYEKHLLFDSAEVSKPKKKKKAMLPSSPYGQRWQVDSNYQTNQRDHSRKRFDSHLFDSNGSSGLFGQHNAKKPKLLMRQSLENSFENNAPIGGSIPSPVASQMSNMSNPNKLMRMLSGRDRGRKAKGLKMPAGQPGSGSAWSLFEDQALIVLVHDMGPNWEFVSDAVNSTLQFKCIYRKPNECKERHKILMDRTSGDGADSAEDSGSSQPYPSTLPGIPKGSARQLFQRLQGPMEEDTLKSHFEKIMLIGKKYLLRKTKGDLKQLLQPHDSHVHTLSQLCPNNLNGGPMLTPLDLCDAPSSSQDFLSVGFEGPHSSGLSISSQGAGSMVPASGANAGVQGSSNTIHGNNIPSSSSPLNGSVRDGRYAVPRSTTFPVDEQQRLQQYNQMSSGRNSQSNISAPGALVGGDSGGARTHPGGSNMGTISGFNRGMPIARPGFPGVAPSSSSMLNSGGMLSSGMVAVPSAVNIHSGVSSNLGNSMVRPRDVLHAMRPSQNQEAQKQMLAPDLQTKVSQGNSQGVPPFGGLNSSFPSPTATSPVSSHPLHPLPLVHSPHHPHLQGAAQQQAYAIRLARERHLQQRFLQQQQLSLQNNPQITAQTSPSVSLSPLASPASMAPITHHQPKHPFPAHGLGRTPQTGGSSLTTPMGKQRPHQTGQQQLQNASRHHPPQRQLSESQQQSKAKVSGPNSPHQSVPSSVVGSSSNHRMLMHPQQPQVQLQPPKLIRTQSQVALQRVLQRNRSMNSDQPNKSQAGEPQSEQKHNICNTSQIGKTITQDCNGSTNTAEVSVRAATQVKAADLSFDSSGTPPTNTVGCETVPEVIQGVSQQQQQQQKLLQNSDRAQVLQAGNRSLLARPNESSLD